MIKLFFIKQVIKKKKIGTIFGEKIGSLKKCFKNKTINRLSNYFST